MEESVYSSMHQMRFFTLLFFLQLTPSKVGEINIDTGAFKIVAPSSQLSPTSTPTLSWKLNTEAGVKRRVILDERYVT